MCLSTCDLSLSYDKDEKCFVGYGYKYYSSMAEIKGSLSKDKWKVATGDYSETYKNLYAEERTFDSKKYWPGFHIFLKPKDAVEYGCDCDLVKLASSLQEYYCRIALVKYKDVTGFGRNVTSGHNTEPCIIARRMKLVKTLTLKEMKEALN